MPEKTSNWQRVCARVEIDDPGARGFMVATPGGPVHGFLVRRGASLYGYYNVCPHAGRMLHWKPDAFLTRDRSLIMCSAHGAVFEIETGNCVGGPCLGQALRPVFTRVVEDMIEVQVTY